MNLLRLIKITFITALISVAATSCLDDRDRVSPSRRLATVLLSAENPGETITNGSTFYFLADDSTMLIPTNFALYELDSIKNNDRYLLFYTKNEPEESTTKSAKDPVLIEIMGVKKVFSTNILQTSEIDTIGNNITIPREVYYSGGVHGSKTFINITYDFYAGNSTQFVYLADNLENASPIKDGYYQLEFRLSGKSDMYYGQRHSQFISFPLAEKYLQEDIKGLKISFKENDTEELRVLNFPYSK